MPVGECFSDKEIRDYYHGRVSNDLDILIDKHLWREPGCGSCRDVYHEVSDDQNPDIDEI